MSVSQSVSLFFLCLPACMSVSLGVSRSVCLSVCLSVSQSVCLFSCLSVCLFVCVFVCRSVSLPVSLSEEPHTPKHFVLPRPEIFHNCTKGILFLVMRQKYSPKQVKSGPKLLNIPLYSYHWKSLLPNDFFCLAR